MTGQHGAWRMGGTGRLGKLGRSGRILTALREGTWLDRERVAGYSAILLACSVLAVGLWVAIAGGGIDPWGRPLGTDFVSFWSASALTLAGRPAAAYAPLLHHAAEQAALMAFGTGGGTGSNAGHEIPYYAFFYPPTYLLLCLPLALLPYPAALLAWLLATGWAWWRAVRPLLPWRAASLPLLAYPAVLVELGHGQNGFLSAALLGGAALALDRRPLLAGALLGGLTMKPQLALLVPLALLAAGRWRALGSAAITAAGLMLAALLVLGPGTWQAFLGAAPLARAALEQDLVGPERMVSVFAALRLLHAGPGTAYLVQTLATCLAAAVLWQVARRRPGGLAEGAVLAACIPLASPYLLDYDLLLLAFPIAWTVRQGLRTGFLPWEKTVLFLAYLLPLLARPLASATGVPLAPWVIAALLAVVTRRARLAASIGSAEDRALAAVG